MSTCNTVPFTKLFSFADSTDYLLMIVGTISAVANGLRLPLMTLLFGELTDSFGETQNINDLRPLVSKVSLKFIYLAMGGGSVAFLGE
ncbi:unnamed protein product [Ilex paraguariensis]|uniref:Uncharacterized protein n=1 Tax=Ilex paraguariensis TaxID=185542 RepID=A0ABC8RKN3_9AQUA